MGALCPRKGLQLSQGQVRFVPAIGMVCPGHGPSQNFMFVNFPLAWKIKDQHVDNLAVFLRFINAFATTTAATNPQNINVVTLLCLK